MTTAALAPAIRPGSGDEWRANWPLVLSAMVGLSQSVLAIYCLGLFMDPLHEEFGWSRTEISSGLTILAIVAVIAGPLVGTAIDRWGSRRLALPGSIGVGLSFIAMYLLRGSLWEWWLLWIALSVATAMLSPAVWAAAVTGVFDRGRSVAIAIMLCGTTLGSAISPALTQYLIAGFGWRTAAVCIGLGWTAVSLAFVIPLFHDKRKRRPSASSKASIEAPPEEVPGLTPRQALRDPSLRKLAVAQVLSCMLFSATAVHFVPLLNSGGISRETAANIAALLAFSAVFGKLGTGWLLDHVRLNVAAGLTFALPMLACFGFLFLTDSIPAMLASTVILGWAGGGYYHASTYLTSRYAGLRHFALIFGVMASLMGLTTGISPVLASIIFDELGSYDIVLMSGIVTAGLAGLLMGTLRSFPDWSAVAAQTGQASEAQPTGA